MVVSLTINRVLSLINTVDLIEKYIPYFRNTETQNLSIYTMYTNKTTYHLIYMNTKGHFYHLVHMDIKETSCNIVCTGTLKKRFSIFEH